MILVNNPGSGSHLMGVLRRLALCFGVAAVGIAARALDRRGLYWRA
jgi:hypothetical protein